MLNFMNNAEFIYTHFPIPVLFFIIRSPGPIQAVDKGERGDKAEQPAAGVHVKPAVDRHTHGVLPV